MAESAQILRVGKPWQEALAEYFIVNPTHSMTQAAEFFGVTLAWLSTVKNSDAFQDYYQSRRREHFDAVSASIVDKVAGLAEMTVDALATRVEEHMRGKELSVDALGSVADLALKSLGFGAKGSPSGTTVNNTRNVTIVVGDQQALSRARGMLKTVRERIIDSALNSDSSEDKRDESMARGQLPSAA
jgi:hypothetical protein